MHFDLTDEQKQLRDMLDAFFADRFDGAEAVAATASLELDRELWNAVSELGLAGILVPEAHGGLGLDLLTLSVVAETLGHYVVPLPVVSTALSAWLLAQGGSEEQRARWLPSLLDGKLIAALALAEPEGWLSSAWQAGEQGGRKLYVEWAEAADLFIVGLSGSRLGLVEAGRPDVVVAALDPLDRSRPVADLDFGAAHLLPAPFGLVERLEDALLVLHAADALGAAHAAHQRAVAYARERRQFGRPIGAFQGLKHQLADVSVELEPARPLYWYAAHLWDIQDEEARRMAALTKAHIGDISVQSARVAIEAHGGIGYTWEHPVHLFLKRAMHDRATCGVPALHRERVAALGGW